jgi:hypothetical protein
MSRTLAPIQDNLTFHPMGTVSDELDVGMVEKGRILFDQFGPEGFGENPWNDTELALESKEFRMQVAAGKLTLLNFLLCMNCHDLEIRHAQL